MPKVDLVREFRINDAIRVASGIENVKSFEEKKNCIKIDATKSREEVGNSTRRRSRYPLWSSFQMWPTFLIR